MMDETRIENSNSPNIQKFYLMKMFDAFATAITNVIIFLGNHSVVSKLVGDLIGSFSVWKQRKFRKFDII